MRLELIVIPFLQGVLATAACLWFHKRGREQGQFLGYWRGRADADNWWLDVEQEVDQTRQKMWKEPK